MNTPFAVINADDFYGASTFSGLQKFLETVSDNDRYQYAMMGFVLENTLTDNGSVARGICEVSEDGLLRKITERTKIQKFDNETKYEEDGNWTTIPQGSYVSMNTWGFTPSIFDELEKRLPKFLEDNQDNILKAEYFLPSVVDELIRENKADVKVLPCGEKWYGVTYKEDKVPVMEAIRKMMDDGAYPEKMWK